MTRTDRRLDWLTARPIAHRGYHDMNRSVFENTLSAFRRAVEKNFAIECDLQLAANGVPVVFHDDDLKRLCSIAGDVRARSSAELAQLSVGGTADRIPSLPDLLKLVAGRVPLVLELKGRRDDDFDFPTAVLECLEGYDGPVALMSFNHWLLKDLKALDCPHPVGLTAEGMEPEVFFTHEEAMQMGLDFISYRVTHLPNPFIAKERASGIPVISWTVRDAQGVQLTAEHADQMTFEGFDPDIPFPQ